MTTRIGFCAALTLQSILCCLASSAQTTESIAAYCSQFKDYAGQQQCIKDSATRSVNTLAEKCRKFARHEDMMLCWKDLSSPMKTQSDPYCLPITDRQMAGIRSGQRVLVSGVDGCSQIWN
jgi:hypothetical protein